LYLRKHQSEHLLPAAAGLQYKNGPMALDAHRNPSNVQKMYRGRGVMRGANNRLATSTNSAAAMTERKLIKQSLRLLPHTRQGVSDL
jgi:hypothetical protein